MSEQIQQQKQKRRKETEDIELDPIHDAVREKARERIKAIIARVSGIGERPGEDE